MQEKYQRISEKVSAYLIELLKETCEIEEMKELSGVLDELLQKIFREVGREVMERVLGDLSEGWCEEALGFGDERHEEKGVEDQTLFGSVEVSSPYFYNRRLKRGKRPL